MKLYDLRTMHMENPLGIDLTPYFSWKLQSEKSNTLQASYHLVVKNESGETVWDSGIVPSEQSTYVEYAGAALQSRTAYTWTVTVMDNHGEEASANATFETGLTKKSDWTAKWVDTPFQTVKREKGYGKQAPATFFFKSFDAKKAIKRARLYATAHGVYEFYLNGENASDRKFAPENTSYEWYLCYQTYDITDQIVAGENAFGMYVADGWYCGIQTQPKFKGYKPVQAALFQIELEYEDGSRETIGSDSTVTASEGPVLCSDLFFGEAYDANREDGFFLGKAPQTPVLLGNYGYDNLAAQPGEPVRTVLEVPCKEVLHTPNGEWVLDFGQVVAGAVRMKVDAPKWTTIKLEHSEVLDKDGNFTMNILLGMADQIVEYTSNGTPSEYATHFSFQGFRYVRVTGLPLVKAEDFVVEVYSTEAKELGSFSCSDARVNRLYENTRWSQRANMLSVPTDCPQREKRGWTGDIQVYTTASLQNEDTTMLLTRWLKSLSYEQTKNGAVPMIIPMQGSLYNTVFAGMGWVFGNEDHIGASAGWSDAAVLVPWQMYQMTGNTAIICDQYDSMKKWCDYVIRASKKDSTKKTKVSKELDQYLWNTGYHWGEWLIPSYSKNGYGVDTVKSVLQTRKYIAPLFAYYTISSMAKMADAIGKTEDAKVYGAHADKVAEAFKAWIVAHDGEMPLELQGAYLMPLYFDLVPEQYQAKFEKKLVDMIAQNDYCLDTGFLATPFLFDTLCKIGRRDIAYKVFFGEKTPSYFNQIAQGATTIWESWFTYDDEGNPMTVSLNHYSFGCVDDWMFRTFNGIDKTLPGFKHIVIAPQIDSELTSAKRSYESPYGTIVSDWKKENGTFTLHAEVPCNTTAIITLPDGTSHEVGSGSYDYSCEL